MTTISPTCRWRSSTAPNATASAAGSPATSCSAAGPTSAAISRQTPHSPSAGTRKLRTPFSPGYRALFDDILAFAHEYVTEDDSEQRKRRVRYWSALALLRCVSSSPAAAAATSRSRAAVDAAEGEDVDEVGRRTVLDQGDDDDAVALDFSPGAETEGSPESTRRRLLEFARRAEALDAADDRKLQGAVREVKALLGDGFHPVVFCRFIDTAEYVAPAPARRAREGRPGGAGHRPAAARRARGAHRPAHRRGRPVRARVHRLPLRRHQPPGALRCRRALRPRLEPHPPRAARGPGGPIRTGESPRCGSSPGTAPDNPIDGVILDVLIRKHKSIRSALGVTVAVPGSSEQIAEALFEGALFRERAGGTRAPARPRLHRRVRRGDAGDSCRVGETPATARRRAVRASPSTLLDPGAVAAEIDHVRTAIGRSEDVDRFLTTVLQAANVPVRRSGRAVTVNLGVQTPRALRQAIGCDEPFTGRFDLPLPDGETYLGRTSPIVEGLASWTLDQALDPESRDTPAVASRCGVDRHVPRWPSARRC